MNLSLEELVYLDNMLTYEIDCYRRDIKRSGLDFIVEDASRKLLIASPLRRQIRRNIKLKRK